VARTATHDTHTHTQTHTYIYMYMYLYGVGVGWGMWQSVELYVRIADMPVARRCHVSWTENDDVVFTAFAVFSFAGFLN